MILALTVVAIALLAAYKIFVVPRSLAHLPRVPVLALLGSYISKEPEDERIHRLILPFANEHGHPLVLVWAFGFWVVHVMDYEIGVAALRDRVWVRQLPPQDLLIWKLVGKSNLAFSVGEVWRRHSHLVNSALQGTPPFSDFVLITQRLFHLLGEGGEQVQWDEISQRVTLDILGHSVLGHNFEAVMKPDSPFAKGYREVMHALMQPPYIFLPFLDKYFPRRQVELKVEKLRDTLRTIIENKKGGALGDDLISRMISNPDFSREELLDNVTVLFIAGHDTTAGGLTSVMYYLAKHPVYQEKARAEVLSVLGETQDPNLDTVTRMPYVFACIREAMRMNNPSNATLPRSADTTTQLGSYVIPPKTLMSFNIAATHHREDVYPNHNIYDPERFTNQDSASQNGLAVFGMGLRQCPARNFAMWELRTVVALLLRTYEWNLSKDSKHTDRVHNGFSFSTNLNLPVGVSVDIRRREKA